MDADRAVGYVDVSPTRIGMADTFPDGTAVRVWGYTDPRLLNNKHLLGEHREVHALLPRINGWAVHPEYARFHTLHTYPEPSPMAWRYREAVYGQGVLIPRREPAPPVDLRGSSIQGVSFLALRHEMLRMAMNERWRNEHQRYNHKTEVPLWLLTKQHQVVLRWYAAEVQELGRIWPVSLNPPQGLYWARVANQRFKRAMFRIRFPHCILSPEYAALPQAKRMDRARRLHEATGVANIPAGADTPWERDFSHHGDRAMQRYLEVWGTWDKLTHHIQHRAKEPL